MTTHSQYQGGGTSAVSSSPPIGPGLPTCVLISTNQVEDPVRSSLRMGRDNNRNKMEKNIRKEFGMGPLLVLVSSDSPLPLRMH